MVTHSQVPYTSSSSLDCRSPSSSLASSKSKSLEGDRNGIPIFYGEVELLEEYKERARGIYYGRTGTERQRSSAIDLRQGTRGSACDAVKGIPHDELMTNVRTPPSSASADRSFELSRLSGSLARSPALPMDFRLADSIPAEVLESWGKEKIEWLTEKGVKAKSPISPENVPTELRYLFDRTFNRKLNAYLDGFHGSCILRKPVARPPLLKALESVDSLIGDLVIMPNHVHILITPAENETLQKALKRIKGASARGINLALGQNGKVWKKHSYDHTNWF